VGHTAAGGGAAAFAVAVAITSVAAGATDLDEVVVTARKRAESVQDVPVAVTAISADSLRKQQFQSLKDANFSVPNLSAFNNQTTVVSAATFIRGVGQDDSTPVQEQGVATYIDDVYMPRAQGGLLDLLDFERIEVLRGPQGTLYGRNSSGGAVKYVTRKPSLTDTAVIAQATIGSFERRELAASFSAPLVDGKLAAKVDVVSRDRDGYITQQSTGKDVSGIDRDTARLALRWQASDTVLVDLAVDGTRDRSGLQGGTPIEPRAGGKLPGGYAPVYGDLYTSGADVEDLNEFDGWGASATVTWDSSLGQFKSVSSYRTWDTVFWSDLGGRPANLDLFSDMDGKTFTQEFQLASSGDGKLKWVVGAFLMQEKLDILNQFLFLHDYIQDTDSMALYGELTYPLSERMRLTLGGRLTEDKKEIDMFGIGLGGTFRRTVSRSISTTSRRRSPSTTR
jgi:iron complex outermembrane receptor protein